MKTVVLESKKRITVLKVGGSCLTGGESVRKTVEKISQIRKEGVLPALVVSALNGITDSLSEIVISSHKRYNPKDSDRILAEGEQLSVKIIESAVQNAGIEAEGILLSDDSFPILTDDQHGNAEILLEETEKRVEERLKPLIEKGVIPIIPGFVGKTMEGGVTTLGRGGSDTTAVVLGRALGVETVILLKDVPGVLTGDPDIISSPQRISHITAEELVQLGYRGGDVFCPKALRYAPEEMKIRIVDFENGDIMNTGTEIIGNLREKSKMKVMDKKKAAITFIGKNISHIPDLIGKASQELMKNNVPYLSVFSSASSLSFYTEEKWEGKALKIFHELVLQEQKLTTCTSLSGIISIEIAGERCIKMIESLSEKMKKGQIPILDLNLSMTNAVIYLHSNDTAKIKSIVEELE